MATATFRIWRGDAQQGGFKDYQTEVSEGMVVLDAVHRIQAEHANDLDLTQPVTVEPMRSFPPIRDLVTDVSWNFRVKEGITPFRPRRPDAADGTWRMDQRDIDRVQEFRKCIECFLCQDVCHVLRDHQLHDTFIGPRFLVHVAALEMHPLDVESRLDELKEAHGIGLCNITKCCTKVCPEHITITDNAIIPLKERVVDRHFDPLEWLLKNLSRRETDP
jgi:succinate dehydrogenase / fumarate reductase iron-sulfur subunit